MKPRTKTLIASSIDAAIVGALGALAVVSFLDGRWGWAIVDVVMAAVFAYGIVRRERLWSQGKYEKRVVVAAYPSDGDIEKVIRNAIAEAGCEVAEMSILRKGVEPVETPSDTPKLTWADHARNCDICREREL